MGIVGIVSIVEIVGIVDIMGLVGVFRNNFEGGTGRQYVDIVGIVGIVEIVGIVDIMGPGVRFHSIPKWTEVPRFIGIC